MRRRPPSPSSTLLPRAVLDWLKARGNVNALGAMGFYVGGHLAFPRCAPDGRARDGVLLPTGVRDGKLGADTDAGTLARAKEIPGRADARLRHANPHVPEAAQRSPGRSRPRRRLLRR